MDAQIPTQTAPSTSTATATPTQRLDLSSLPNEILDRIFSLLPVPDARLSRLISHRFLPSATRASFPILIVSPLLSDAETVQSLGNVPEIAPCVKFLYYVTDTLAEPRWLRAESSPTLIEEIAPEEYTWNATDHPRNWLPHYVNHPEGSERIDLLSPEWYQYRYRPLISHRRRSPEQIALDRERYEEICSTKPSS